MQARPDPRVRYLGPFPHPCSPNPACHFPALGSPVGSCASYTEDRSCHDDKSIIGFSDDLCGRCTASAPCHASLSARHQACLRLDGSAPFDQSGPSLMHVMHPEIPASTGVIGSATPVAFLPSVILPHLRPLPSTGITRRLQSYGPLRHPAGPA